MIDGKLLTIVGEKVVVAQSAISTNRETVLNTLSFCNQSAEEVVISLWLVPAEEITPDLDDIDDRFRTIHERLIPASDTWYYTRADAVALRYGDALVVCVDSGTSPKVSVVTTSSFANDR